MEGGSSEVWDPDSKLRMERLDQLASSEVEGEHVYPGYLEDVFGGDNNNKATNVNQISENIFIQIRLKLSSLKAIPDNAGNRQAQVRWCLPLAIFDK